MLGVPMGLGKMAMTGSAAMTTAEANTVFRQLKKGSLGMAALALGYFVLGDKLGGLYSGRRRDEELQPGEVDTGLGRVPSWATAHQPLFSMLHLGAAIKREEKKVEHGQRVGTALGTVRSMGALMEEVPYVREQRDLGDILHGNLGPLARSYAVPALLQEVARMQDRPEGNQNPFGRPVKRTPHGLGQNIEMGVPEVPGLPWLPSRKKVPVSQR
jgi:hypothetical protein